MTTLSIVVPAYNEGKNIYRLLASVAAQRLGPHALKEIVVVASGCTDNTVQEVRRAQAANPKIGLVVQPEKLGKASAVNLGLSRCAGDIVCLAGADLLLEPGAIAGMLDCLANPAVGLVGAHPVPVNPRRTLSGYFAWFLWEMHHRVSLLQPKAGELICFRNQVKQLPPDTAVDEAWLESFFQARGLKVAYAPQAIVRNKGPDTLSEILAQRVRIHLGHYWLARRGYQPSTPRFAPLFQAVHGLLAERPLEAPLLLGCAFLEGLTRLLARIRLCLGHKNPFNWQALQSTKELP